MIAALKLLAKHYYCPPAYGYGFPDFPYKRLLVVGVNASWSCNPR